MNKVFYFSNNKDPRKYERISKYFDKKINFTPNVHKANKKKYEKPFKSISWTNSGTLDEKELKFLIFEAKYYLVGPEKILMALFYILGNW